MRSSAWLLALAACGGPVSTTSDAAIDGAEDAQTMFACGPGTHEQAATCIADPHVELRAPPTIVADGYTLADVRVLAFDGDGQPLHDRVIVAISRPSAGTVVSPVIALGELGGAATVLPCNAADSSNTSCAGPAQLSVALANAPQTPLATANVELVAPMPVDFVTACLGAGNILHYESTNFSMTPALTITSDGVFDPSGTREFVRVNVVANSVGWSLYMATTKLGIPILTSVYEHAQLIGYDNPGDPIFDLDDGTCTPVSRFQIYSYVYDTNQNKVTSLLASFEQHCDFDPTRRRTGCVHFSQ